MKSAPNKTIGILAIQGSFAEHAAMIEKLGVTPKLIRSLADVADVEACILPGGESTTMLKLLQETGLDQWLITSAKGGMPLYGTCAGMIVLATLGLIEIKLDRNAYGAQLHSFEDDIEWGGEKFSGIFIRAPKVKSVGKNVTILATHKKDPVLVRQNNILVGSFHPELTDSTKIHKYFLDMLN